MEGRISRESLLMPADASASRADEPVGAYRDGAYRENAYRRPSRRRTKARSSYRGSRVRQQGIIPEGRDLLIVQTLASGFLLLLVLAAAFIKTELTEGARESLKTALTKNSTAQEAFGAAKEAASSFAGGAGAVFEIFGGEIEKEPEVPLNELKNELNEPNKPNGAQSEFEDFSGQQDEPGVQIFESGASVDGETMKYILENARQESEEAASDTAKN